MRAGRMAYDDEAPLRAHVTNLDASPYLGRLALCRVHSGTLRKGQQVTLAFAINLGAITKLHRRTAVVAHVSRGGTGLMMESYSASARSS